MISSFDPLSQLVGSYIQASSASVAAGSATGGLGGPAALNASNTQAQIAKATAQANAELSHKARYTAVAPNLDALSAQALAVQRPGALVTQAATSSNAGVLTAQASQAASPGTYRVVVSQLAASQANASRSYASATNPGGLGTGSLAITTAGGATSTFAVDSTTSLSSLASAINAAQIGVSALAQRNGDGTYSLAVQGTATGAGNTISYAQGGSVALNLDSTRTRAAQDAAFTVDGRSLSSTTNTVTSVAPGLTLSLVASSASSATVTVQPDSSQLVVAITGLVRAFNNVIAGVAAATAQAASAGEARDSLLATLGDALAGAGSLRYPGASAAYTSLPDLGVTQQLDGTLAIDADQLLVATANDASGVAALVGGSQNSVAAALGDLARRWGGDGGGVLSAASAATTLSQQRASPVGSAASSAAAYALDAYQAMAQQAASRQQVALARSTLRGMLLG